MVVQDRFEVLCNTCDRVSSHSKRSDAFRSGRAHHEVHQDCVDVFDVMAQRGQPQLWAMPLGQVMENRYVAIQ